MPSEVQLKPVSAHVRRMAAKKLRLKDPLTLARVPWAIAHRMLPTGIQRATNGSEVRQ
jgi:hypothetical protein